MKTQIHNITNTAWIDENIQKISNLFHGRDYNPAVIKIILGEYNKLKATTDVTEELTIKFAENVRNRISTDIDIYGNSINDLTCSDDEVISVISQLHKIDDKAAFLSDFTKEYYNALDLIPFSEHEVDEIVNVVCDKRRIEIDRYGNIFKDIYVYSIVNILQKTVHLVEDILIYNQDNICNDHLDFTDLVHFDVEIGLLRQDMIMAIDIINRKLKELKLTPEKSEGGKKSSPIRRGILKAVVTLRNDDMYGSDTEKIINRFRAATPKNPITVGKYTIYRIGDEIIESYLESKPVYNSFEGKLTDEHTRKETPLQISSLIRYYMKYSVNPKYINKYCISED